MPIPLAAAEPARPMKCSLPMLLTNIEAPTWVGGYGDGLGGEGRKGWVEEERGFGWKKKGGLGGWMKGVE